SELRLPYPGIARLTEVDTRRGDEVVLQKAVRPLTLVAKHRMVRDDRFKLIYVPARTGVRWMLFDTRVDPGEERDVAAAHPDMTERDGYLVPRAGADSSVPNGDLGLVRLGDDGSPPPQGSPP